MFSNKYKINLETFLYIILLVGFQAISCLPYFFSVQSRVITIPFRALVLFFSLYLLCRYWYEFKFFLKNKQTLFFLLFWLFYLFSVFFSFRNYSFSPQFKEYEFEIYLKVIGINLIPSLAVLTINPDKINYNKVFVFLIIVLFIVFSISISFGMEYNHQGRASGILSTYSIDFGHYGVTLALLSIYRLIFFEDKIIFRGILHFCYIFGLYIIYASATRGPFVSFLFALLFLLLISGKIKYIGYLVFSCIVGIIMIYFFSPTSFANGGSAFFYRLSNMILHGDSSGRMIIYENSVNEFFNNVIFGGRFVFYDGTYAHNLILDILMSMGVLGLIFFLVFFKSCLVELKTLVFDKKGLIMNNKNINWIHILFVQYFTFELVSGCLFCVPTFWYLLAMMLVIHRNKIN